MSKKSVTSIKCTNLTDALIFISENHGADILENERHLIAFLSDVFPDGKQERKILKDAFSVDIPKTLRAARGKSKADKQLIMNRSIQIMTDDCGLVPDKAWEALWSYAEAVGWESRAGFEAKPEPVVSRPLNQPQPGQAVSAPLNPLQSQAPAGALSKIDKLMIRAWQYAEDGDWEDAFDTFEDILKEDPTYAPAFLGLICVDLKVSSEDKLKNVKKLDDIIKHKHYKRIITDPTVKARVDGYIQTINDRLDRERVENAFNNACGIMKNSQNLTDYKQAITAFTKIDITYNDINEKIKNMIAECKKLMKEMEDAQRRQKAQNSFDAARMMMNSALVPDDYHKAIVAFSSIDSNYPDINKKIKSKIAACEQFAEAARKQIVLDAYNSACKMMNNAQSLDDYRKAVVAFNSIDSNYQDIDDQIKEKIIECERLKKQSEAELDKMLALLRKRFDPKIKAEKQAELQAELQKKRQADEAQLEIENGKLKAETETKREQLQRQYEADYQAWQDKIDQIKQKYAADHKAWQEAVSKIQTQAAAWKAQGRCPHDGGKLGWSGVCKECKKKVTEPLLLPAVPEQIKLPAAPVKPQMPTFTPRKLDESRYILKEEVIKLKVTIAGIDWQVLDVQYDKILLIADKVLEKRFYHQRRGAVTWKLCTLRKYLNNEFYNKLGVVKLAVVEAHNITPDNPWFGTGGGKETYDKVFLLSLDEVVKYFGDSGDLAKKSRKDHSGNLKSDGYCIHDQYNSARIAKDAKGEACWWWLRSPGTYSIDAAYVGFDGRLGVGGSRVPDASGGVRPALWLHL